MLQILRYWATPDTPDTGIHQILGYNRYTRYWATQDTGIQQIYQILGYTRYWDTGLHQILGYWATSDIGILEEVKMAQNWILLISELRRYQGVSYKSDITVISGKISLLLVVTLPNHETIDLDLDSDRYIS